MIIYKILEFCSVLLSLYSFVLVGYALMSWFPGAYETAIGQFVIKICRPYLRLFERLNLSVGPIDLTIIVAIFVLNVGGDIILRILQTLLIHIY